MSDCKSQYGIIGKPLGHSFSEQYFTDKFALEHVPATYQALQIDAIEEVLPLLQILDGMNVTYPYKEEIIPYLTALDETARVIGAVNVVHHGKGYNTDWIGFRDSLRPLLCTSDKRALLLGTGGVSKAIQYALQELGISYTVVSRKPTSIPERGERVIGYEEIDEALMAGHQIVVNCTPLGMHPYEKEMAKLPYELLTSEHMRYDCIYNPEKTRVVQMGERQGCRIKNGLEMLHLQADEAWRIWSKA